MNMQRFASTLSLLAAAAAAACLADGAAAGSGSGTPVNAVEGLPFTGQVASYTSTATLDERFVAQAHLDVLGRAAVVAELSAFGDFLGNGGTRTQVAQALLGSDEYRSGLTSSIYAAFLRRQANAAELASGTALLNGGATDAELKALVLGSSEYLANQGGGTVHGFLTTLYSDVLGRALEPVVENLFTQQLANGKTRTDVALTVLTSLEARQRLADELYQRFLHRSATPGEQQAAASLLQNGGTDEDMASTLVGSMEYLANVPASFATATIDWGDGSGLSAGAFNAGDVVGAHTYSEEGAYPLTVVVHDLDGTVALVGRASVADAPLSATSVSFSVLKKTTFTRTVATFTDANPGGTSAEFSASIDWGDGHTSAGTIGRLAGRGFAVIGSHRYDVKGSYQIVVHITDTGGSTAAAVSSVSVTAKA
jgi:Domain of unknown function (DUF4214)